MKTQNDCPIANKMLVLREEFDDWAILFDPDTGNAYGMNPTSVFIFKQLNGKNNCDSILKKLNEGFEKVPSGSIKQVEKFITDLVERGFAGYELKK